MSMEDARKGLLAAFAAKIDTEFPPKFSNNDKLTLTRDILDNKIWCITDVPRELASICFFVGMAGLEPYPDSCVQNLLLYGHINDAFPRGVNSYPMFMAVTAIRINDWNSVITKVIQIRKMQEALLNAL